MTRRPYILLLVLLLSACSNTNPTLPLEGRWLANDGGHFDYWEMEIHLEGTRVIGRVSRIASGQRTFTDVPVTGVYPRVYFDAGAEYQCCAQPGTRAVFEGGISTSCDRGAPPCIHGTIIWFPGTQFVNSNVIQFFRTDG